MTSAWNEPPSRADGEVTGPGEGQLDMFEILPRAGTGKVRTSAADGDVGARKVDVMSPLPATRDFLDVGGPDSDELRRLEESIRWLMNAGNMRHLPPATTLPPVSGLPAVEGRRDDSLILDPETLFPPRAAQRRSDILRGAAKVLLVSAIAAPTAYFVASWAQFPGALAPSDAVDVSMAVPAASPPGVQVAALGFAPANPVQVSHTSAGIEPVRAVEDTVKASPPPQHVAALPVEKAPQASVGARPAELKVSPEQPARMAPPSDPGQSVRDGEAAAQAIPVVAPPPKPSMRPEEMALMVERGRTLFDSGDLAAARLFFRRAANAGDAGAAIAMGATYDPEVLNQRFIRGIEPDVREAQRWYDKARALGGGSRVDMLAHR